LRIDFEGYIKFQIELEFHGPLISILLDQLIPSDQDASDRFLAQWNDRLSISSISSAARSTLTFSTLIQRVEAGTSSTSQVFANLHGMNCTVKLN
jgi:hypothetical protein